MKDGSKAYLGFGRMTIEERHRHRYDFYNEYKKAMEDAGLIISGIYTEKNLVEVIELVDHPWFVASQFHPEFKSRPNKPHPLFREFVGAAYKIK